ncbi:MAG: type II secretion system protein [SAR324 cluster bacterium]|uniref:Type II secretion system protein n=1 Tax=SAR324 cluster bacterium TaxID=2024889 RepID=A0A7X9FU28_9DELT|nr:type II secretion system protein [SAR324 cluster bacterium]
MRGFSLIELLVSLILFELVAAASMAEVAHYIKTSRDNQIRTEAAAAAQTVLDEIRASDPAGLPGAGNGPAQNVSIGSHVFQVTPTYCAEADFCTGSSIRQVRITVSLNSRVWYEVDTAFAQLR